MGRKRINGEAMSARFPPGTFSRIDAVLEHKEKRADMIRKSVDREIARRLRPAKRQARLMEATPQAAPPPPHNGRE